MALLLNYDFGQEADYPACVVEIFSNELEGSCIHPGKETR
jgi:hypothetical protein